jgi:hypothetical protein
VSDEIPYLERLGQQLRDAPVPAPRRAPTLLLRVAAVLLLVVIGAVAFNALRPATVSAGVDLRRVGNRVVLRVSGEAPPAKEIEEVAHRNGLDIVVRDTPVSPSQVGQLFEGTAVKVQLTPDGPRFGRDAVQSTEDGFEVVSFPVNWKGSLELLVGRPAKPGEPYSSGADALHPKEPLACQQGATVEEIRALARTKGITIRWWLDDTPVERRFDVSYAAARAAGRQGYRLAYARRTTETVVIVELTPGGQAFPPRAFRTYPGC